MKQYKVEGSEEEDESNPENRTRWQLVMLMLNMTATYRNTYE